MIRTLFILFFSVFPLSRMPAGQALQHYNFPEEADPSSKYQVKINGADAFVYGSENSSICTFSFEGKVELEVSSSHDIKWVDIRPLSRGVTYSIQDNRINFILTKPVNLSLELNGETTHPLFIFANPVKDFKVNPSDENVLYFEAGRIHDAGVIRLESNQTLYIEGGAIVEGLIRSEDSRNIKLLGYGMIDPGDRVKHLARFTNCSNILMDGLLFHNSVRWTVVPVNSEDIIIQNIKQVNWDTGSDGIDLVGCHDVIIEGCFLKNNDDCVVIKSYYPEDKYALGDLKGRNVYNIEVRNTTIWNMSWGNGFEIGFELRCDEVNDIRFINCDIIHVERGAAMSIHNGDYARVSNILYEDIRIEDASHKLIDLAIILSQYSIDRPTELSERQERYMEGAWDGVLRIMPGEESEYGANRGHIENIIFRNIQVTGGEFPFSVISGFSNENVVDDVLIEGLYVHGRKITSPADGHFFIENARNILFK